MKIKSDVKGIVLVKKIYGVLVILGGMYLIWNILKEINYG
jgi:hypothetical protein